ncbi:hypothetical protein Shyhy01_55590 [Streptomyces hygroscopicus subsp. hygroscopicus]|nr:hypothetical protein Shyhy01_55590 [Streptomyces hygroscopicus subsp. hygroscopicus]
MMVCPAAPVEMCRPWAICGRMPARTKESVPMANEPRARTATGLPQAGEDEAGAGLLIPAVVDDVVTGTECAAS